VALWGNGGCWVQDYPTIAKSSGEQGFQKIAKFK